MSSLQDRFNKLPKPIRLISFPAIMIISALVAYFGMPSSYSAEAGEKIFFGMIFIIVMAIFIGIYTMYIDKNLEKMVQEDIDDMKNRKI